MAFILQRYEKYCVMQNESPNFFNGGIGGMGLIGLIGPISPMGPISPLRPLIPITPISPISPFLLLIRCAAGDACCDDQVADAVELVVGGLC